MKKKILTPRTLAAGLAGWVILIGAQCTLPSVSLEPHPQVEVNGYHSVFLDQAGHVWTWGNNQFGQLGNATTTANATPSLLSSLPTIAAVASGGGHTLALTTNGQVWAWGGNADNTLGVSTPSTIQTTPLLIPELDHITAIAAGDGHGVALRSDGKVWTWGINQDGQTGLTQATNHPFPEPVPTVDEVVAVAAGDNHTLVLRKNGTVWSTGFNDYGQLGDGTTGSRSEFTQVKNLQHITSISAGESFSMALDTNGDVWTWGDNRLGQAGLDPQVTETVLLPTRLNLPHTNPEYVSIAAGGSHGLAMNAVGQVFSWGYNYFGQLGYETPSVISPIPELVPLTETAGLVSAGDNNNLILSTAEHLWAWGDNQFGQVGDGTTEQRPTPVLITLP